MPNGSQGSNRKSYSIFYHYYNYFPDSAITQTGSIWLDPIKTSPCFMLDSIHSHASTPVTIS
jgi:hypothetical protein